MAFGIETAIKGAPPMNYWPALVVGFFWIETRSQFDIIMFVILLFAGGVSYIFTRRLWESDDIKDHDLTSTPDDNTLDYVRQVGNLASKGNILNAIELLSPRQAAALPPRNKSAAVVLLSLALVLISFVWLWVRSSLYILSQNDPSTPIVILGMLPYFFFSFIFGVTLWVGTAEPGDSE